MPLKLRSVDDEQQLWSVEDLLEPHELAFLSRIVWRDKPWHPQSAQEHLPRRSLRRCPEIELLEGVFLSKLPSLGKAVGCRFDVCHTNWWYDEAGFVAPMHTDGELRDVMQMYWIAPGQGPDTLSYGTVFYYYSDRSRLMHRFESRPNHGYLMLNHVRTDGSQPLLWHEMINPVPPDYFRLTSYTYLR